MVINVGQFQQNFHLCHPNQECKDTIGPVWGGPCILNADGWMPVIVVIYKSMSVSVVVTNNLWILEPHYLPIDIPFSLIVTSIQGDICCHKNHGVIWLLHSMNTEVLAINYSRNCISITYLLTIKVLLHRLSVDIIWQVPHFLSPPPQKNQPHSIK